MKPKNCHVESRTNNHLGTVLYTYSPSVLLESDLIFRYFQSSSSRDKFCNQKRVHIMCPQNHSHSTCCTGCGIPGIGGCHGLRSDPRAAKARSQKGIVLPFSLSLNKSMTNPHKFTQVYCISRDPHDAAGAGVAIWIELWHGKRKVYWKAMVFIVGTAKMTLSLCFRKRQPNIIDNSARGCSAFGIALFCHQPKTMSFQHTSMYPTQSISKSSKLG